MQKNIEKNKNSKTPAQKFLDLIRKDIIEIQNDKERLIEMAEEMADSLLKGGNIFAPPVNKAWTSEFSGRAGGLMCLKGKANHSKDIAFFALPDPRNWEPQKDKVLKTLLKGKAKLFVIGRKEDLGDLKINRQFAGFTGGVRADIGMYRYKNFNPFASTREFKIFVRGWITTGEMICACIRKGKMPIIYMSVWFEGAIPRNSSFTYTDFSNYYEPSLTKPIVPLEVFHKNRYIPPLPSGYATTEFLQIVKMLIDKIDNQADQISRIGQCLAEAKQKGKKIHVVAAGHCYPGILELPDDNSYPLTWGVSRADLKYAVPSDLKDGDVALHFGYGPTSISDAKKILKRGVKLIHTSPYGRRIGIPENENFLWFDLPWRPGDAVIDIPGYSVRMLPSSSTAHSIAYNAILCEMAEVMGWQ